LVIIPTDIQADIPAAHERATNGWPIAAADTATTG